VNLVFDLGGVVVAWDPPALIASVFDDPDARERARAEILQHPDWLALDRGTLDRSDAIARGAARSGLAEADVTTLFAKIPEALAPLADTVALMPRLKARGHRLYVLSNMHHASIEHLERSHDFWQHIDGKVVSCRVHLIKPEPAIYQHLLETFQLEAAETVFIDDMAVNTAAAREQGIQTITFESAAQCEAELRALGCL